MEVNKLTDLAVQKSRPGEKDYAMSDGAGLYLWVTTAGGKLWRWGYVFDGKNKTMSYGKYPYVGSGESEGTALGGAYAPSSWHGPHG